MPSACGCFPFILIEIFYASFSSQELTIYEFEKNKLAIIFICHWKYCLFLLFKNQSSIHIKLFLKCEGKKLPFGLCTAGIFTDHGINTHEEWGTQYDPNLQFSYYFFKILGRKPLFSHFVSKLNFLLWYPHFSSKIFTFLMCRSSWLLLISTHLSKA